MEWSTDTPSAVPDVLAPGLNVVLRRFLMFQPDPEEAAKPQIEEGEQGRGAVGAAGLSRTASLNCSGCSRLLT